MKQYLKFFGAIIATWAVMYVVMYAVFSSCGCATISSGQQNQNCRLTFPACDKNLTCVWQDEQLEWRCVDETSIQKGPEGRINEVPKMWKNASEEALRW